MLSTIRRRIAASILLSLVLGSLIVTLPGCNTVKGAGTDLHNAGQAGQDAINGR